MTLNPFQFNRVIFSETEPEIDPAWRHIDWKWFNTTNSKWYELVGASWQERGEITFSPIEHSHPTHGDINFTGSISSDGEAGLTGARTIDGHTLTFKNGILVGYQPP